MGEEMPTCMAGSVQKGIAGVGMCVYPPATPRVRGSVHSGARLRGWVPSAHASAGWDSHARSEMLCPAPLALHCQTYEGSPSGHPAEGLGELRALHLQLLQELGGQADVHGQGETLADILRRGPEERAVNASEERTAQTGGDTKGEAMGAASVGPSVEGKGKLCVHGDVH